MEKLGDLERRLHLRTHFGGQHARALGAGTGPMQAMPELGDLDAQVDKMVEDWADVIKITDRSSGLDFGEQFSAGHHGPD
jgi:hypothetical protein